MSERRAFDLVVIGSGPGGQKAAVQGAKAGKRVAIVERERTVGGACVHRGTIPSKTLRESALRLLRLRTHGAEFGFELPPQIELAPLLSHMQSVIDAHDRYIDCQLDRNGIERIHGRASFRTRHELEVGHVDGSRTTLEAATVVIATGSRPRDPTGIPVDHEHVLDSDSVLSMIYLPRSLTVLGGGVIASEYASIFASLGVEVTMIDRYDRPLGWMDAEIVDRFVATFESQGGRFLASRSIRDVNWDGISQVVTELDDGTRVESDKMLVAQGRVANVDGLAVENAGIALDERGLIPVDADYRTAVEGVFAVGDVVGPPSLASSAMEQGRRAACRACGIEPGDRWSTIPMGIYAIPEIAAVGMGEAEATDRHGGARVGRAEFREVARGQISDLQDGMLKMVADPAGERLLGVQIVGGNATELIHVAQIALIDGWSVRSFVENVFNFPTLAEAYRVAALQIVGARVGEATVQESVRT